MNLEGRWNWRIYFNGNLTKSRHTTNLEKYEQFLLKFPFTNFKSYKTILPNTYIKYLWDLFTLLLIFVWKCRRQANHIFNSIGITTPDAKIQSTQTNCLCIRRWVRKIPSKQLRAGASASAAPSSPAALPLLPPLPWGGVRGLSNAEFCSRTFHRDGERLPQTPYP